jgi:hypothetical protein
VHPNSSDTAGVCKGQAAASSGREMETIQGQTKKSASRGLGPSASARGVDWLSERASLYLCADAARATAHWKPLEAAKLSYRLTSSSKLRRSTIAC